MNEQGADDAILRHASDASDVVDRSGPLPAPLAPVVSVAFERVAALELLAMTLAHLNDAEARGDRKTVTAIVGASARSQA
jgi:hypothetical protein